MSPEEKEAVGRAILRGVATVESFLRRRGLSMSMAQEIALECAFITWRSIIKRTLALPLDVDGYDQKLTAYMRTVAWRLRRNHRRAGDIMLRHDCEPGTEVLISRTYSVEPAIELASEIAAETPKGRRFLLAMLREGEPSVAAASLGEPKNIGKWTMRSIRGRAAKRLAAS